MTERHVLAGPDVDGEPARAGPSTLTARGRGHRLGRRREATDTSICSAACARLILTKVSNGLGKTTELEYATSTSMMLAAAGEGRPWAAVVPTSRTS